MTDSKPTGETSGFLGRIANYTRTYSWMANQLGHMTLGLATTLLFFWVSETLSNVLQVDANWPALVMGAVAPIALIVLLYFVWNHIKPRINELWVVAALIAFIIALFFKPGRAFFLGATATASRGPRTTSGRCAAASTRPRQALRSTPRSPSPFLG